MPKPIVDVAIAILIHRGKILVGWREEQQHQGGKHEFPGGKVEQGETPEEACRREIYEEVGIGLKDWHQFDYIHHEYDDIIVNLHLFHSYVPDELLNLIHQPWAWYTRDQLLHLNFPKANKNIIKRLYWPHLIKISNTLSTVESNDALLYWRIEEFEPQYIEQLTALDEGQRSSLIRVEFYSKRYIIALTGMNVASGEPVFFSNISVMGVTLFVVDPDDITFTNEIKHKAGAVNEIIHVITFRHV